MDIELWLIARIRNFGRMLVSFLLLAGVFPALCWGWQGKVVELLDADVFSVAHDGKTEKVRLFGIDCPEVGQPFHNEAKFLASYLLLNKVVEVIPVSSGTYGISHVLIRASGKKELVNEELIGYGMAWVNIKGCTSKQCEEWRKLELLARKNRVGLWVDTEPVPPWEWRKKRAEELRKSREAN